MNPNRVFTFFRIKHSFREKFPFWQRIVTPAWKLFDGWRHHRQHKTGLWRIISIAQKSITPISGSAVVVQRPYFSNDYIFKMVLRQCLACNAMVSFKNDLTISLKIAILLHAEEFISRRQYSNLSLSVDKISFHINVLFRHTTTRRATWLVLVMLTTTCFLWIVV